MDREEQDMAIRYAARTCIIAAVFCGFVPKVSGCLTGYTFVASPMPVNGTYACGQTVTFCFTVTGWTQQNTNWFHGISVALGPGWDASTLTPGTPPANCGGGPGTWDWYTSVTGTASTNIGPQGPGFFFNTGPPGNPGNNFGDNCSGTNLNWQFCWTVTAGCVSGADLSVTVDTFGDSETGSWSSWGCSNDPIPVSAPAVVFSCPNAGIGTSVAICSSEAPVPLLGQLLGTPTPGGTWTDPNGNLFNGTFDPAVDIGGNYTYAVSSVMPPCYDASTLTVSVSTQPVAGTDSSVTVCSDGAPFALFDALGGDPDPGGNWTNAGGVSMPALFNPATGASGVYTYQLTAPAPCLWVQAHAFITVVPAPSAGSNGTLDLCVTGMPVPLFSGLGGAPTGNGSWTDSNGNAVSAIFDPAAASPGTQVFTYLVTGAPPCGSETSTVTVTVHPQPNAGTGASLVVCSDDAVVDLSTLLGPNSQSGGIWTIPGGGAGTGVFTPGQSADGNYAYTVPGQAPCINSIALVQVTTHAAPNAGTDAVLNICEGSSSSSLFALLGGADAGGSWTGPNGSPSNGIFDPSLSEPGVFTYTVQGTAPCVPASATVTVNIIDQPNAGSSITLPVCNSAAPVNLFNSLGTADANGVWTGPGGIASTGMYTPGVSPVGAYTYTISGTAPCITATAVVTVSAFVPTDAGTDGTLLLCSSDGPTNLFPALGGSPSGGTWTTPNGSTSTGTIVPSTALSGDYSYSVPANGPCPGDVALVAVTITPAPNAGTNGTTSLCSSDQSAYALVSGLAGTPDAGGSWTAPDATAHGPNYVPGTDQPGTYTYTVQGGAPCGSASATLDLSVMQAPDAGYGGTISICQGDPVIAPQSWLTGNPDPGGVWTSPNGTVITQVDPATAASGGYMYTVPGIAPCPAEQAIMAVTVNALPQAGTDGTMALCMDAGTQQLLDALGGSPDLWGTWSGPSVLNAGSFTPGVESAGTYTYAVPGVGACSGLQDSATVTVTVTPLPVPLVSWTATQGCIPFQVGFHLDAPADLVAATWNFGNGNSSNGYPQTSHTYTAPGTWSVHVTVTDAAGCMGTGNFPDLVHASAGPAADFHLSAPSIGVDDPQAQIFHVEDPTVGYNWTLDGSALVGTGNFSFSIDPPTVGDHIICLTATDTVGCSNDLCRTILVDDNLGVFIPNAFTPDGDGDNDVFLPVVIGYAPETYSLNIFDRWGKTVFSTSDAHEPWTGALKNAGDILPQAVYVWRITARDRFSTDEREWFGTVTLVK